VLRRLPAVDGVTFLLWVDAVITLSLAKSTDVAAIADFDVLLIAAAPLPSRQGALIEKPTKPQNLIN
jgi:hypothetical protein